MPTLEKSNDKVIASIENGNFSIYTFLKEGDDVQEIIHKAENQFTNFPEWNKKYVCIEYDEFLRLQADHYMNSCKAITEETYWEMLEVLPPIYIGRDFTIPGYCVLNAFMVSECLTYCYYDGYIKYRNKKGEIKYATKVLARGDRNTYWTEQDLDKLEEVA